MSKISGLRFCYFFAFVKILPQGTLYKRLSWPSSVDIARGKFPPGDRVTSSVQNQIRTKEMGHFLCAESNPQ